jgi:hypothetical protein
MAWMAASLTWSGVSKSGSPAPKLTTSMPAARIALARPMRFMVADSWRLPAWRAKEAMRAGA